MFFTACERRAPSVDGIHATRMTLRVRVNERVRLPEDRWSAFEVYKCTLLEETERAKGTINLVVPRLDVIPSGTFVPRNYESFTLGADYRVLISTKLPHGWEALADEAEDDRLGLVAVLEVIEPSP